MKTILKLALAGASVLAMGASASASDAAAEAALVTKFAEDGLRLCTAEAQLKDRLFSDVAPGKEFSNAMAEFRSEMRALRAKQRFVTVKPRDLRKPQTVFLDFGSEDPFFYAGDELGGFPSLTGVPGQFEDYQYTAADKAWILASMNKDYKDFNIRFTITEPRFGDYSVIRIGDNDANPIDLGSGGILFGRADSIDWGNTIRNDTAFADASLWKWLHDMAVLQAGIFNTTFTRILGAPSPTGETQEERAAELNDLLVSAMRFQSANTSSHELGHILGLRHQDSFGGIGQGLPPARSGLEFFPERYDMFTAEGFPRVAEETFDHLMASGASTGIGLGATATVSRFISERSAAKLAANERPIEYSEAGLNRIGKTLVFNPIPVPNTIEDGVNQNRRLRVRDVVVNGSLEELDEVDEYKVFLRKGDVFSGELILDEDGDASIETVFAPVIRLIKEDRRTGEREIVKDAHWGFEGWSPFMMDVEIEESGTYIVQVEAPNEIVRGSDFALFDLNSFGLDFFRQGNYVLYARTLSTPLSKAQRFPDGSFEDEIGGHFPYPFGNGLPGGAE